MIAVQGPQQADGCRCINVEHGVAEREQLGNFIQYRCIDDADGIFVFVKELSDYLRCFRIDDGFLLPEQHRI